MTMMMGNDGYKFMSIGLQLWPGFRRIWTGSSCYAHANSSRRRQGGVGSWPWELVRENPRTWATATVKNVQFPGISGNFWTNVFELTERVCNYSSLT